MPFSPFFAWISFAPPHQHASRRRIIPKQRFDAGSLIGHVQLRIDTQELFRKPGNVVLGHPTCAGLYARVSTHDQQAIPLPTRAIREYANRRGWTIALQAKQIGSGASQRERREQQTGGGSPRRD